MWAELRQTLPKQLLVPVARQLARTGITPNTLTILGFLLNIVTAAVIASDRLLIGGILILVSGLFDMLDGALARASGQSTRFGALLDSTLDRYSEAAILAGLLWVFMQRGANTEILLVFFTIVGSLLISYVRARAEGLGLDCKVGLLTRPERIVILAVGLILNQPTIMLWVLALLTNFTAVQRLVYVWQKMKDDPRV